MTNPLEVKARELTAYPVVRRVCLADVTPEKVAWMWPGYVPFGKLTVLEGDPGLSKSTLTIDFAARLSSGRAFPDGSTHDSADTLLITYEDGLADTVRPRAEAAGADLSRLHVLQGVAYNGDPERFFTIPDDIAAIRDEVTKTSAKCVVIDPLDAALSGATDTYKSHDIRLALAPLAQLAEATGVAVIVIRHLTKGSRGRAILAGGGSIAIGGAARVVLAVHRHPDDNGDAGRRVLAVVKCNLARMAPSRVYDLVAVGDVARIEWGGEIDITADALTAARGDEDERSTMDAAKDFVRRFLADGGKQRADVMKASRAEGFAQRTVERAKVALGVRTLKDFGTSGMWLLPTPFSPPATIPATPGHIGGYGENGENGDIGRAKRPFERCSSDEMALDDRPRSRDALAGGL